MVNSWVVYIFMNVCIINGYRLSQEVTIQNGVLYQQKNHWYCILSCMTWQFHLLQCSIVKAFCIGPLRSKAVRKRTVIFSYIKLYEYYCICMFLCSQVIVLSQTNPCFLSNVVSEILITCYQLLRKHTLLM